MSRCYFVSVTFAARVPAAADRAVATVPCARAANARASTAATTKSRARAT